MLHFFTFLSVACSVFHLVSARSVFPVEMRLLLFSLVGMDVIDLVSSPSSSSSNEDKDVQEDHTIREPVFPVLSSQEVEMIATAIGEEAMEAALKRTQTRGLKGHSKTRTPRPLTKVSDVEKRKCDILG